MEEFYLSRHSVYTALVKIHLIIFCLVSSPKCTLGQTVASSNSCITGQGTSVDGNASCPKAVEQLAEVAEKDIFMWEKETDSREHYHERFCKDDCDSRHIQSLENYSCPAVQCFPCMCEWPACGVYGTCCPSVNEENKQNNQTKDSLITMSPSYSKSQRSDATQTQKLEIPVLKCEAFGSDANDGFLSIHSCPHDFKDSQTRKLCEQDNELVPVEDMTLDQFARVQDTGTKVTYYNKHCARCNRVSESDIAPWNVNVTCDHFLYVYEATTFDQFLSYSLRPNSTCYVNQGPSVGQFTPCELKWFSGKETIDSCNVTGLWRVFDEDVKNACQDLNEPRFQVYAKTDKFSSSNSHKNIFCALCNMATYPLCKAQTFTRPPDLGPPGGGVTTEHMPFRLILGFQGHRKPKPEYRPIGKFRSCAKGEWPAPNGQCLKVHCSRGKVPENETCVTALSEIRGLGYELNVWFVSNWSRSDSFIEMHRSPKVYTARVKQYLTSKVKSHLQGSVDAYRILLKGALFTHKEMRRNSSGAQDYNFWMRLQITASTEILRDEFEANLAKLLESLTWHALEMGSNHRLIPRLTSREQKFNQLCSVPKVKCIDFTSSFTKNPSVDLFLASKDFLNAKQNFSCQHIQFDHTHFTFDESDQKANLLSRTKLTLSFGSLQLVFTENNELTSTFVGEGNILYVCRDILDSKLKTLEKERKRDFAARNKAQFDAVQKAQHYLTLICLIVSIICLTLTLVTYFSFKVLRNQAGLNNIFLCGSLLMAQVSLLISFYVSSSHPLCSVLGMVTHFLWLWMFVWSFICCLHMFRVFTVKTPGKQMSSLCCCGLGSRLLSTVLLSLAAPMAVVSLVIILSLVTSGGNRTGYGRISCSLDSNFLVGIAAIFPLALVTVCNVVFFGITARKIRETGRMQSRDFIKKNDRTNFYIYIKLSTVTGAFWVIHILAEVLNNDVLWFVAILANSLQGLFIFLSYICNKRVLSLYTESLRMRRERMRSGDTPKRAMEDLVEIQSIASKGSGGITREQPASADTFSSSAKSELKTQ